LKIITEILKASDTGSIGYCELKQHKLLVDEESSELLDERKQIKLQCLQNQNQIIRGNVNNVRREAIRNLRNKGGNI
jgi:hypothetical protein